jgi:hypothetical protein
MERCLIILACNDYEGIAITLQALNHTIQCDTPIVVILNGASGFAANQVEYIAREWAKYGRNRHVVKPIRSGGPPLYSILEVIKEFDPIRNVQQICKLDEDIIPIRKGWLDTLAKTFVSRNGTNMGFVTGLINNNCWGFDKMLDIFGKREDFRLMQNYKYAVGQWGERIIQSGEVDINQFGTIWRAPYMARWLHSWSSLDTNAFLNKTERLEVIRIGANVAFSIGCIYSSKELWMSLDPEENSSDEYLINKYCFENVLDKWAVMSEPIIHLYYYTHRTSNRDISGSVASELAMLFNDKEFITAYQTAKSYRNEEAGFILSQISHRISELISLAATVGEN